MRDVPVREHHVTANFPLEICLDSDVGHTAYNGVTRQIPVCQCTNALYRLPPTHGFVYLLACGPV
jgi:hypothetical protein